MFSLPNPKKTITIDFSIEQVMSSIPRIHIASEVTIEIRRKMGSFDTEVEVSKANYHFKDLVNHLSEVIVLSEADFNKNYSKIIQDVAKAEVEQSKPWYTGKNVPVLMMILGFLTLPFLIGFLILPLGIYARIKNKEYLNQ